MVQMSEMKKDENLKDKTVYLYGVKLNNKEDYDRLMEKHSVSGFFGINFKGLFQGYPTEYPTLVCYEIDSGCLTYMQMSRTKDLVNDGFLVQICKEQ